MQGDVSDVMRCDVMRCDVMRRGDAEEAAEGTHSQWDTKTRTQPIGGLGKSIKNDAQRLPKWSQNGAKMLHRWPKSRSKLELVSPRAPKVTKMVNKSPEITKNVRKTCTV